MMVGGILPDVQLEETKPVLSQCLRKKWCHFWLRHYYYYKNLSLGTQIPNFLLAIIKLLNNL
jgi:hypothetical protein